MEGRKPPPKASHPFPNNPNLANTWCKPYLKAFAKSMLTICGIYYTLGGINMYLTRHEKGPFGMDLTTSKEEFERKWAAMTNYTQVKSMVPNVVPEFESNKYATNVRFSFSDGADFIPVGEK